MVKEICSYDYSEEIKLSSFEKKKLSKICSADVPKLNNITEQLKKQNFLKGTDLEYNKIKEDISEKEYYKIVNFFTFEQLEDLNSDPHLFRFIMSDYISDFYKNNKYDGKEIINLIYHTKKEVDPDVHLDPDNPKYINKLICILNNKGTLSREDFYKANLAILNIDDLQMTESFGVKPKDYFILKEAGIKKEDFFNIMKKYSDYLDVNDENFVYKFSLLWNEFPLEKLKKIEKTSILEDLSLLYNRSMLEMNDFKDEDYDRIIDILTYSKNLKWNAIEDVPEIKKLIRDENYDQKTKKYKELFGKYKVDLAFIALVYYKNDVFKGTDEEKYDTIKKLHEKNPDKDLYDLYIDEYNKKHHKEKKANKEKQNKKLEIPNGLDIKKFNDIIGKILDVMVKTGDLFSVTYTDLDKKNAVISPANLYKTEYIQDILNLPELGSFLDYLDKNKDKTISILDHKIKLTENIQFIADILRYKKINKLQGSFDEVIKSYEKDYTEFLEVPEQKDNILVTLTANKLLGGDYNGAFVGTKTLFNNVFEKADKIDLSASLDEVNTPDEILTKLEKILQENPNKNMVFLLALHGGKDGSVGYSLGNINKSFFTKVSDLSGKYPNFKVYIDSCYSGTKFDKLNGNIMFNSGKEVSTSGLISKVSYNNIDLNKDGKQSVKEMFFRQMTEYKDSLLTNNNFYSFIRNKEGDIKKLP